MSKEETSNESRFLDEPNQEPFSRINMEEIGTATDPHPRPLSEHKLVQQAFERIRREYPSSIRDTEQIGRGISTALDGAALMINGAGLAIRGLSNIATGVGRLLARESASVIEKASGLRPYLNSLKRRG